MSRSEFDGVLASTSICFDLSVFEIFCTLGIGGRIVLVRNALALPDLPADVGVTLVNTVPSAIAELVRMRGVPASVRTVNLAGEPLTTELADAIYALGTVKDVNDLYGPSEDTTFSTFALETVRLVDEGRRRTAATYCVLSTAVALAGCAAGYSAVALA